MSTPDDLLRAAEDAACQAVVACGLANTSPTLESDPAWGMLNDAYHALERGHALLVQFRQLPQNGQSSARPEAAANKRRSPVARWQTHCPCRRCPVTQCPGPCHRYDAWLKENPLRGQPLGDKPPCASCGDTIGVCECM